MMATNPRPPSHLPSRPLASSEQPRTSAAAPSLRATPADFQAGFSLLVYAPDPQADSQYAALLDRLVGLNVNSLAIVFPVYTDGVTSDTVRPGPDTPSADSLATLTRFARARGFTVMWRPILDESSLLPAWRGEIRPRDTSAWYQSYGSLILGYARLAAQEQVDSLAIGTELNSMEQYVASWQGLLQQVRQVYRGQVTYAYNYNTSFQTGLWSDLDFISVDAYFPLDHTPAGASAAQMSADWQRWLAELQRFDGPYHKPIVFTEVGVVPKAGAHLRPWDSSVSGAFDLDEQRAYYEATCDATPHVVQGLYWWAAGTSLPARLQPSDFDPLSRPAEDVVRSCYAVIEGKPSLTVGLVAR